MKNQISTKENIYSNLLGIDDKILFTFYSIKFNDNKIEAEFQKFILTLNFYIKIFINAIYIYLFFF